MAPPDSPASDVYTVVAEDRDPKRSRLRWLGTVVAGLFEVGDAPAVSTVVIRRTADGALARRFDPGWRSDVDSVMTDVLRDLAELDVASFEAAWLEDRSTDASPRATGEDDR